MMADANAIIQKLSAQIAQLVTDNAVLRTELEETQAKLAELAASVQAREAAE